MWLRFALFLIINFWGLAIGSWLMDGGPKAQWYIDLNQAPWTPPGWLFGLAWTTIMICFSFYLAKLFTIKPDRYILPLFIIHFVFNVGWNWVFFNQRLLDLGLVVIISLMVIIFIYFVRYKEAQMRTYSWLLLPYMIWIVLASTLNGYIAIYN